MCSLGFSRFSRFSRFRCPLGNDYQFHRPYSRLVQPNEMHNDRKWSSRRFAMLMSRGACPLAIFIHTSRFIDCDIEVSSRSSAYLTRHRKTCASAAPIRFIAKRSATRTVGTSTRFTAMKTTTEWTEDTLARKWKKMGGMPVSRSL